MKARSVSEKSIESLENFKKGSKNDYLDLDDIAISEEDVASLSEAIKNSTTLGVLRLNMVKMSDKSRIMLCNAIKDNTSLFTVIAMFLLQDQDAPYIAAIIKENKSLENLIIPNNYIKNEGICLIAEALEKNDVSLKILNIADSCMGDLGLCRFGNVLRKNSSLIELDLSDNVNYGRFANSDANGNRAAIAIAEGLRHNSSLKKLDLKYNLITDTGGEALYNALLENKSLQKMNLEQNYFKEENWSNTIDLLLIQTQLYEESNKMKWQDRISSERREKDTSASISK